MSVKIKNSAAILCLLHASLAFGQVPEMVGEQPQADIVSPPAQEPVEVAQQPVEQTEVVAPQTPAPAEVVQQPVVQPFAVAQPPATPAPQPLHVPEFQLRERNQGIYAGISLGVGRVSTQVDGGVSTIESRSEPGAAFSMIAFDEIGVRYVEGTRNGAESLDIDLRGVPIDRMEVFVRPLGTANDGEFYVDTFHIRIEPRMRAALVAGGDDRTTRSDDGTGNMRFTLGADAVARILHLDPSAVQGRIVTAWVEARAGVSGGMAIAQTASNPEERRGVVGLNASLEGFIKLRLAPRDHLQLRGRLEGTYNLAGGSTGEGAHSTTASLTASYNRSVNSRVVEEVFVSIDASRRSMGSVGSPSDDVNSQNAASVSFVGGSVGAAF